MLLDTHVVLWVLEGGGRIGPLTTARLGEADDVAVSAASIWEISIKVSIGKLRVPDDLPALVAASHLRVLPVTGEHAWSFREVDGLPHRDPFDRLLIAQAAQEGMPLVTADRVLLSSDLTPGVDLVDART